MFNMMDLQIIKYDSPVLRKKSLKVARKDKPSRIAENLFDTLKKEQVLD